MHQLILGMALATVIAALAFRARALTASGTAAAFVVGAVTFGLGGWTHALPMLLFFISSTLLSRWRRRTKEALGYEKSGRRDSGQVWANGGIATLLVLIEHLFPSMAHPAYVAYLAANADTWATEIGSAVGGKPISIVTGKRIPVGESGGVSLAGADAAIVGALVIALTCFHSIPNQRSVCIVLLAGTLGSFFDSLLGATLQAQWTTPDGRLTEKPILGQPPARGLAFMTNDCVNFTATAFAAILALVFDTYVIMSP